MHQLVKRFPVLTSDNVDVLRRLKVFHDSTLTIDNFDDYIRICADEDLTNLRNCNLSTAKTLLVILRDCQHMACVCLHTMLRNFRHAVRATPAGPLTGEKRYQLTDIPFSWLEEHTVYDTVLRLRLFEDLKSYAPVKGWTPGVQARVAVMERSSKSIYRVLQLETIYEHLVDTVKNPPRFPVYVWSPPSKPEANDLKLAPKLPLGYCTDATFGGHRADILACAQELSLRIPFTNRYYGYAPLIQSLGEYGLVIWDYWRLYQAGLLPWVGVERLKEPDWGWNPTNISAAEDAEWDKRWFTFIDHIVAEVQKSHTFRWNYT